MIPHLPPEIVAEIQALAEVGSSSEERKKTRVRFKLVNKQWKGLVDHFTHILVLAKPDLAALTAALKLDRIRTAVATKTLSIEINLDYLRASESIAQLATALGYLNACESVKVHHYYGLFSFGQPIARWSLTTGENEAKLLAALLAMPNIRHFEFQGSFGECGPEDVIEEVQVESFARHWPKLKTLTLNNCQIEGNDDPKPFHDTMLHQFDHLTSLTLLGGIDPGAAIELLIGLPVTVTDLAIELTRLDDDWFAEPVCAVLSETAWQFISFYALATMHEFPPSRRGMYDDLIGSLVNVDKLTISPYAVSNLDDVLGPLGGLEHLALAVREVDRGFAAFVEEEVEFGEGPEFPADELVDLLVNSRGRLGVVEVWAQERVGWSEEEQRDIEAAAAGSGIKLEWVQPHRGRRWPFFYPQY